jgi:hypothetical protein
MAHLVWIALQVLDAIYANPRPLFTMGDFDLEVE